MLGLEKGTVRVIPYNSEWKRLFEEEKSRLQSAVGKYVFDIQHVGSTSIPGMAAKPIIDIAVAVNSFEEASVCIAPIEQLGYEYKGENGVPRRRFFAKENPTTHHVHINEIDSHGWNDHIDFRDYLMLHHEAAHEYAKLKIALAQRYPSDRVAYLDGKAAFIEHILQLARSEKDTPHT